MSDVEVPVDTTSKSKGANISGRTWKVAKQPMRPKSRVVKNKRLTSWELKEQKRLEDKQFKDRVKALKDEKAEEKQKRVQALKERREKKEEEERYEKMATKMHAKKVERMRRREKRNKMLKER
ncbi:similar to Saccharomyces cerevisiae YGL029W CGR1 Protein involved in nucleolar integrity and processing of the pre-rRNA for the 60S ribosome subunit [Maudiozyma barnettii]|uniref:rRNA-processing protein n=1 Tax=Maudiozyma barnettii TaxID=61262 RepID=A0A8H2VG98_9SACH|nr:Cgr1p [Kazachstania barnettii]CAB4255086.1 similar to Saccharomyces cerevisiae YGL029W CGR1 Protein involved in nucleolar integrity and processing of the pre-rRNA for the 60S ribosome subunit [Kazachstania barnettii]CAD1783357.1 similar to Saccharomyces cerevisiae YGL029W CGR1 Protein involved in nucleolar integrity and processing of the pre-rRNA for the 60S ribosome subunit [Kazachstania barnettii]